MDKQTFLAVFYTGNIRNRTSAHIDVTKVLFYPHRDGIEVSRIDVIKTVKYIVWNSLAIVD